MNPHESEPVAHLTDAFQARTLAPALHPYLRSWLNLIEAWFSVLNGKALTYNSFSSVTSSLPT